MKMSLPAAAVAIAAALSTSAHADDCRALKAAHGPDQVWNCVAAYNNGKNARSRSACFMDIDAGMAWVGKSTGTARGTVYNQSCHRNGETVTYNAYIRRR